MAERLAQHPLPPPGHCQDPQSQLLPWIPALELFIYPSSSLQAFAQVQPPPAGGEAFLGVFPPKIQVTLAEATRPDTT